MLDLYHATRDDLIAIVLEQRDALAERDRRIAASQWSSCGRYRTSPSRQNLPCRVATNAPQDVPTTGRSLP